MTWTTDNRWVAGRAPETATAAYGARWIDAGVMPAQILGDRQGFAYNDMASRDALIHLLEVEKATERATHLKYSDGWQRVVNRPDFVLELRRTGGYVYCEGWIP